MEFSRKPHSRKHKYKNESKNVSKERCRKRHSSDSEDHVIRNETKSRGYSDEDSRNYRYKNKTDFVSVNNEHSRTERKVLHSTKRISPEHGDETRVESYSSASIEPSCSKEQIDSSSCSDSEDEIMFQWDNHKWELNRMFFQEHDFLQRDSDEYKDFFIFLRKYQNLQKQKKIREVISKTRRSTVKGSCGGSSLYGLPKKFDNRYFVNFSIKGDSVDALMQKLPPVDETERDNVKRLSRKRVEEFRTIILLYRNFLQKKNFEKLQKLRKCQKELPIAQYRHEIIRNVMSSENNVILIAGDTGCGKSTQVPQFLLHAGFNNIACTQPRRIACISLCRRVAHETLNEFGSQVGYQIRFERKRTEHTKIVFLTEGVLLRQVSIDSKLSAYDVIILDEIHERHLHTDFLLGVVKCLLMQRKDIKVILMSATINLNLFTSYFLNKAPVIQVPGRLFPIKLQYFPIPAIELTLKSDRLNPAPYLRVLQLIDAKYRTDERGDVLMFLSGFSEINAVCDVAKLYAQQTKRWVVLPLHSNLSVSDQEKVFDIPPDGVRKCIVSTNIAETSITIDGVRFVVDSGKVKEMSYDPETKMQRLKEFWVSQASAEQRKGRAGRTGPGVCFRLYSQEQFDSLDAYSTPEICRVPLDSLVLQLVAMGMPDVRLFPFIDRPAGENLDISLRALQSLGALTAEEELTTTGKLLSQLPVDVSIGKMLLMGSLFHEAETTLSLAAALSVQSVFTNRSQRDPDCIEALQPLVSHHGDPLTLLAAYKEWLAVKSSVDRGVSSRRWCRKRGLEEQRFYEMTKLRSQFSLLLQQAKLHEAPETSSGSAVTAAERAQRHGELQQLRRMQRHVNDLMSNRSAKRLKMDADGGAVSAMEAASDTEHDATETMDSKHLEFNIRHDEKQLKKLLAASDVRSFKDLIMLKVILTSGLYPNVALADEHNNYKANCDQMFHTPSKPFVALHPTSVFAKQPEMLELTQADIVELPGFTSRHPASTRHQLLVYVSLLETNKAFLMNCLRVPAAQSLLLFSQAIDTNADCSILVCDKFVKLKFPDSATAQDLLARAVYLRKKWNELLDLKLTLSQEENADVLEVIASASALERSLSYGIVEFYTAEPLYSICRLLASDVKVLYKGPGLDDAILDGNPFTDVEEVCITNDTKGGVNLTENVVYNSLLEPECRVTTLTEIESVCCVCNETLYGRCLARLRHVSLCLQKGAAQLAKARDDENHVRGHNTKEYFCPECGVTLWLSIKDIFAHKKQHL